MQIKAIPTFYKGTQFKSRLESNIAFFLDGLGIKWVYEPKSFLLSSGKHYWPDFYLPELKMWIEGKGVITKKNIQTMISFSKDYDSDIILWGAKIFKYFSSKINYDEDEDEDIEYIGETIFFMNCNICNNVYIFNHKDRKNCNFCNVVYSRDEYTCINRDFPVTADFSKIESIKKEIKLFKNHPNERIKHKKWLHEWNAEKEKRNEVSEDTNGEPILESQKNNHIKLNQLYKQIELW